MSEFEKGTILEMDTALGLIRLRLRPDAAPVTAEYIKTAVADGLYNGTHAAHSRRLASHRCRRDR